MVNLLRSGEVIEWGEKRVWDAGLEEQTTLNNFLCESCLLWFADTFIDADSLLCVNCTPVDDPGEGADDERELESYD